MYIWIILEVNVEGLVIQIWFVAHSLRMFFLVIDWNVFKMTKKIKSFRSVCLKICANVHCYSEF